MKSRVLRISTTTKKKEEGVEYYRCTAKRPTSEDGEQRSSGARVNERGWGWGGEGWRCLHRRLFAKYWPIWKLDQQLILLLFENVDHSSERKTTSPNFYAQAPLSKRCAKQSQLSADNQKHILQTYLIEYRNMNVLRLDFLLVRRWIT